MTHGLNGWDESSVDCACGLTFKDSDAFNDHVREPLIYGAVQGPDRPIPSGPQTGGYVVPAAFMDAMSRLSAAPTWLGR